MNSRFARFAFRAPHWRGVSRAARGLRGLAGLALTMGFALAAADGALAQTCQSQFTNINFGSIDPTTGLSNDGTGTYSVQCQGLANRTVRVCPNLGSGSGGDTGSGSPRIMLNGASQLLFTFFQDAARSLIWGSAVWPWAAQYPVPQFDIALGPTGQASQSFPIYARILAGQNTAAAGAYSSTFSGGHTLISSGYSTVGNCAAISALGGTHPSFTVSATVARACSLATSSVDFGTRGGLAATVDASGQIRVTCTSGASYSIGLDGGLSGAPTPTSRKMVKGANSITYGLYGDAARAQPWFNTAAFFQSGGTGTGSAQTLTVYGRIPAQTTPPPGVYTDTVVVVVTY